MRRRQPNRIRRSDEYVRRRYAQLAKIDEHEANRAEERRWVEEERAKRKEEADRVARGTTGSLTIADVREEVLAYAILIEEAMRDNEARVEASKAKGIYNPYFRREGIALWPFTKGTREAHSLLRDQMIEVERTSGDAWMELRIDKSIIDEYPERKVAASCGFLGALAITYIQAENRFWEGARVQRKAEISP